MIEPDPMMVRVGEGIGLSQRGERGAARAVLDGVWHDIGGDDGDPVHRCAAAHALADLQDDAADELRWDLRALAAAEAMTDEQAARAGLGISVLALYPSLHLNLADSYRRVGELGLAREHLAYGRRACVILADDGYRAMIEGGLDRLEARLADT